MGIYYNDHLKNNRVNTHFLDFIKKSSLGHAQICTDRQTDKCTDRQTGEMIEMQIDREMNRHRKECKD